MSACVASSPSASKRSASSSRRAVTYEYAGSFSISARADSTTPLRTSSIATPSYRSLSVALRMRSGSTSARPVARLLDEVGEALEVERLPDAVLGDVDDVLGGLALVLALGVRALLRALLAIEHVRARDFVLAAAHERQLDLVLDFLDVDGAAFGLALDERDNDGVGEVGDLLAHARRSGALAAVHGEERLGHRDGDLGRLEADHRPVAADDLVLRETRIGAARDRTAGLTDDEVPGGTEAGVVGCAPAMCMGVSPGIVLLCVVVPRFWVSAASTGLSAQRPGRRGIPRGGEWARRPSAALSLAPGVVPDASSDSRSKSKSTISCVRGAA